MAFSLDRSSIGDLARVPVEIDRTTTSPVWVPICASIGLPPSVRALRMQVVDPTGFTAISQATRRLIEEYFVLKPWGRPGSKTSADW